jgi:hypothetical protein
MTSIYYTQKIALLEYFTRISFAAVLDTPVRGRNTTQYLSKLLNKRVATTAYNQEREKLTHN